MGKTGRRPKAYAKRTPGGRISRSAEAQREVTETEAREARSVVALRRMRERMLHNVTHPLYGYPLGKLALEQYITTEELDAGRAWAELTFRHAQVMGLMLPKCRAIDWGGSGGRSLSKAPDEDSIERIRTAKDTADARIRSVGIGAMTEMQRVCICDEEPQDRQLLRRVLQKLLDK